MISTSAEYQAAVVGSPRRVEILAIVDLSDPDLKWGPVTGTGTAPWSKPAEVHDKILDPPPRYATLERGRWLLDGSFRGFPAGYQVPEPIGWASDRLSGADGTFSPAVWVQESFTDVRILQMLSVFFSSDPADGVPADFRVDVYVGDTVQFSKSYTDNRETEVSISGFTVYTPTAIRVTCTKMSLPSRRLRVMEILTGLYERWPSRMFASFSCTQQGDFSCLSLPYGSVTLSLDNKSRRFEPRRKDGIFQSIEERQGVDVYIGVRLPSGAYEHVRLGLFYMAGDGWKTGDNSLSVKWYLVDIIGLLSQRTFIPPEVLPTTLAGWLESVVSQLGYSFGARWSCDPAYADRPVTANSREDVTGKTCEEIIRWACQASGTWPRADAETGKLCAEPLWNQGNKVTLRNLTAYPVMKANQSLAALIFVLSDGTQYVISGNSTSSEKTVTIKNPFLHTQAQALEAARLILAQYGGNIIETTGRGDPSGEIGDVDTVWLDQSNATTARRMSQTLQFQGGVLQGCTSKLLQADGSYLWTDYVVLTESGTWQAPAGVSRLRLVLGRGGQGGGYGQDGYVRRAEWSDTVEAGYGEDGPDGQGGEVWYDVIDINPGQTFAVTIGQGGAPAAAPGEAGTPGGHTTFGPYSSASGQVYANGYTDIANGLSFARTGVPAPLAGSGDGGKGGAGGTPGAGYLEQGYLPDGRPSGYYFHITKRPGPGSAGVAGASGFVMISWEKAEGG